MLAIIILHIYTDGITGKSGESGVETLHHNHHRVETLRSNIASSLHHRVETLRYHIGRPAGTCIGALLSANRPAGTCICALMSASGMSDIVVQIAIGSFLPMDGMTVNYKVRVTM